MTSPSPVRTSLSVAVVSSTSLFNGTFTTALNGTNSTTLIFNSSSPLTTIIATTNSLTSPLRTTSTTTTHSRVALLPNARVGPMPPIFSPDADSPIRTVKTSPSSSGEFVLFPSGRNNEGENNQAAPFYDASSSERVIIVGVLFAAMIVIGIVVVGAVVVNGRRQRRQQRLKVERLIAGRHPRSPSGSWNRSDVPPPLREINPAIVYGATFDKLDTLDSDSSGSIPRLNITHTDDALYFSVPPKGNPFPHDPTAQPAQRRSRTLNHSSLLPHDQVEDEIWEANKRRSNRSSFMALLKPRNSAQDLHPNAHRYAHDSDASLTSLNILLQHAEQSAAIHSPSPTNINSRPSYNSIRSELANRNSSSNFQNQPASSHSSENVFIGRNRRIKSKGSFGSQEDQVELSAPKQRQSVPDLSPDGANSSSSIAHLGFSPVTPVMYTYIPTAPSSPTKAPAGVYVLPTTAAADPNVQMVLPGTYMYYILPQADVINESTAAELRMQNNEVERSSMKAPQEQRPMTPAVALFEATDEEGDEDLLG
ncbi:hypothetical protein BJ742DRAFT_61133 [Cladochytrium replicatum]|nr:hypothetical protein BJ742DRAFT_61133 [Cladochytrium replicatum]